ncbi:MAG: NAD-dependent dehydratase [Fluviicola sp.]|nr:MAG: NAD-dependent dehydratase [Fluviicola sp.]
MKKVLVAGANGQTGRQIVSILKDKEGYEPVAMVRKETQIPYFEEQNISTVIGDLEKELSGVVKGMDEVVFAAGSGGDTSDQKTVDIDENGAKSLIDASVDSNVEKFVMLSSMGTDQPDSIPSLKQYLKSKKAADEYLKSSGLTYSIIKPGMLTNDEGKSEIQAKERLNKSGKIPRNDVAKVIVQSLNSDILKNKEVEILEGQTEIGLALTNI